MLRYLLFLSVFIPLGIAQNTAVYPTTLPTHDTFTVLANSAKDDLTTTITSGATSIVLSDASEFFSPGSDEAGIIKIEDEYIKYCTISSNTLTVCSSGRGFDGSSAAAHNAGVTVLGIYAAHHHNQLAAELVAGLNSLGPINTVANLPSAPIDGNLARVTDGNSTSDCTTGSGTDIVLCMYDTGAGTWSNVGGGVGNHNILSSSHSDSLTASVVLGDIVHGNATPKWARLAGNTTTIKQFLSQTGNGSISAVPSWAAILDGDIPSTLSRDNESVASGDISGSLSAGYTVVTADAGIVIDSDGTFGAGEGVAFGDGDTEIRESSDDVLEIFTNNVRVMRIDADQDVLIDDRITGSLGGSFMFVNLTASTTVPTILPSGPDTNTGLGWAGADQLSLIVGAQEFLRIGGSQTALFQDTKATTGDTTLVVKEGAATSNNLFELQANNGDLGWHFSAPEILISGASDPADTGVLRLGNTEVIGWEAATPGTDLTLSVDASDILQVSGAFNAGGAITEGGNAVPNSTDGLSFFANSAVADLSDSDGIHGGDATLASVQGATTSGNCAEWDADGDLVDSGGTCGGAGSTQGRYIQFEEHAVSTSGSPADVTFDNVTTIQLPNAADSEINAWFRVPPDAVVANDILLALNFAPNSAPGVTNNKVKLKITARVNNTSAGQTAGDTITLANNTDWDSYTATNNKIVGGTYAVGDLIQMKILRDTSVANNAAVGFNIAKIAWTYTSSQ